MSVSSNPLQQKFQQLYGERGWGINDGETRSGPGSTARLTVELRSWLKTFLELFRITSITDAPCGEWGWMQYMDLGPISYLGFDVVPEVIELNRSRFPQRTFIHADLTSVELPYADLIICKDCFQHLSNSQVQRCLEQFLASNSRYLLTSTDYFPPPATNDFRPQEAGGFYPENLGQLLSCKNRWIANVALDRKIYSLWRLNGEATASDFELILQVMNEMPGPLFPSMCVPPRDLVVAPNFYAYGSSQGRISVLPRQTGVFVAGEHFTLPISAIEPLLILQPSATVDSLFKALPQEVEDEKLLLAYLFFCAEIGLINLAHDWRLDHWSRVQLCRWALRFGNTSSLALTELAFALLRPPRWLDMVMRSRDVPMGVHALLSWAFASNLPVCMPSSTPGSPAGGMEISVSIPLPIYLRARELSP